MDRRGSTMHDASSIVPGDFNLLDDELPVPGGIEILGAQESRYLDDFFAHRGVNGHGILQPEEGLGGVYTPNWLLPPSVVGHNVSYGYWDEGMVANMFPQILGNEVQKQSPAAAPLVFGYPAQPSTTTASPIPPRQPPTATPSNLMMPDLMTPQSPRPLHTQHGYLDHQATDDVIAAASVLSHGNGAHFDMFYSQKQQNQALVPQAPSSVQFQAPPPSANNGIQSRPGVFDGMAFHGTAAGDQSYSRRPPRRPTEIRFGSDPNFNNEKFVSQSARDTTAAMVEEQLAALQCLERNDSAAPTRAASPNTWAPMSPNTARRSSMVSPVQLKAESYSLPTPNELTNGEAGPPTKRRRSSKPVEETRQVGPNQLTARLSATADELQPQPQPPPPLQSRRISEHKRRKLPEPLTPEAETITTAAATKKRRKSPQSTTNNDNRTTGPGNASGRRKSSQAKPPREPLNEDQKRENHIRSEQKRRGIISRGYDMLYELVPVLREGRTHKAHALQCAADFIESLAAGNQRLRELLAEAGLEEDGSGSGGRGLR
ncbi:hypothetical protein N657DRAFT_469576 [Parathielavia appendiculata]|uniref:BHLH domain-containing protein n=1 Tax=Parathielavia appendiculata TaxID=2587402 RepID=A0AAN6TXI7_9PEZI|nr:hypothetical protein N657DRAFT_469576 [Parathielavia appendiculata]